MLCLLATRPYDEESTLTGGLFTVAISLVAPIVIGRLLRSRAALNRALREKAALLERRREEAAGRAVSTSARGSRASCTTSSPTRSAR